MHNQNKSDLYKVTLIIAFFLAAFLYFRFCVEPVLSYQSQQPVFFSGPPFFSGFLNYPGGLADYTGAFLTQFFYYSWAGALIITLMGALLYIETVLLLSLIRKSEGFQIISFIPTLMLFAMHHKYHHFTSISLGILLTLAWLIFYLKARHLNSSIRLLSVTLLALTLYIISCGFVLIFLGMVALIEFILYRRMLPGILSIGLAFIIPWLASRYCFIIDPVNAFFYLLPFSEKYKLAAAPFLLIGFYPLMLISASGWCKGKAGTFGETISRFISALCRKGCIVQPGNNVLPVLFLIGLTVLTGFLSIDRDQARHLKICYFARRHRWHDILKIADKHQPNHILTQYHTNRALYHTGRLSQDLFMVQQNWGVKGLILPIAYDKAPLDKSDIHFELGNINEAQRWAYEALTIIGETPSTLQRLALISILKADYEAAQKYLNLLKKTPLFKKWAKQHERFLHDTSLIAKDPEFRPTLRKMNHGDFLVRADQPLADLNSLLDNNPVNKMAFEYLMAGYLLTGQISEMQKQLELLKPLNYHSVPRLYEEALFIFMFKNRPQELKNTGLFRKSTFERFRNFQRAFRRTRDGKASALEALKSGFGESYWYYVITKNIRLR